MAANTFPHSPRFRLTMATYDFTCPMRLCAYADCVFVVAFQAQFMEETCGGDRIIFVRVADVALVIFSFWYLLHRFPCNSAERFQKATRV
jgi:hypothetical protein